MAATARREYDRAQRAWKKALRTLEKVEYERAFLHHFAGEIVRLRRRPNTCQIATSTFEGPGFMRSVMVNDVQLSCSMSPGTIIFQK